MAPPGPEPPALAPGDALREAQRLLEAGRPFEAHEVLEARWKATTGAERALWRGLAQLAVGLTHRARGNPVGERALLARGAETLGGFAGTEPHGVPVDALRAWAAREGGDPPPRLVAQAADERA